MTSVPCHVYCAGQTVPVGLPAEVAPSRDGEVGRGQTLSGDLAVGSAQCHRVMVFRQFAQCISG